jgi:hypothetical protein
MWSHLKTAALAGIVAALAATATVAFAGSGIGGVFNLGQTNSVNQPSVLAGTTAGAQAVFYNASTATTAAGAAVYGKSAATPALKAGNLGSGSALGLSVAAGHAPMTVNSATKVANLNADKLDGLDSSQLQTKLTVDGWHEVGTGGEPAFLVDIIEGEAGRWANVGDGNSTAAFFKDPFGVVHIKGYTCFRTTSDGICHAFTLDGVDSAIFVLPPGDRPAAYKHFPVLTFDTYHAAVLIDPSGAVYLRVPGVTHSVALDGINFRAGS